MIQTAASRALMFAQLVSETYYMGELSPLFELHHITFLPKERVVIFPKGFDMTYCNWVETNVRGVNSADNALVLKAYMQGRQPLPKEWPLFSVALPNLPGD
jgi:hypothetical protein